MKDLLQYIVTSLVDHPGSVMIEEKDDGDVVTLSVTVHADDIGKIIGREGNVIRAIRGIIRIVAIRENRKVYVKINDQESEGSSEKAVPKTEIADEV